MLSVDNVQCARGESSLGAPNVNCLSKEYTPTVSVTAYINKSIHDVIDLDLAHYTMIRIVRMRVKLLKYMATAEGVSPTVDKNEHESELPHWSKALFVEPSSASETCINKIVVLRGKLPRYNFYVQHNCKHRLILTFLKE